MGAVIALRRPAGTAAPETAEVTRASVRQRVQAAGLLTPSKQVDVGAQVSGQVTALHVELGQTVRAGQLLVSIDPDTARSDVQGAEAAVAEQRAAIAATVALSERARTHALRTRRLLEAGGAARADVEAADAEDRRLAAEHQGQLATLDRLSAELSKRRLALSRTAITAPIDGVVVNIAVAPGQTVNATQTTPILLTLANIDRMTVRTKVAEADVLKVKVGQTASFTTLSGLTQALTGTIRVIQPVPERSGNASFYNVLFEVDNPGRALLPQMTVHVQVDTGAADSVPTVPSVALGDRLDDGRYEVFVWRDGAGVERRAITIGLQDATRTQVLQGLVPGDRVVLSPAEGARSAPPAPSTASDTGGAASAAGTAASPTRAGAASGASP